MTIEHHPAFISRRQLVQMLARFRQEWEQAAEGEDLLDLEASVGLLLADLAMAINLTAGEMLQALGEDLVNDLQEFLVPNPGGNGFH